MFLVYLHPLATTFKLGVIGFDGHRFGRMHVILGTDRSRSYMAAGLGAPDLFAIGSRTLMVFNAIRTDGVRSIGLAERTSVGWRRCGEFIAPGAAWAPKTTADPMVIRRGRLTYVYYGGGRNPSLTSDLQGGIGVQTFRAH